MKKSKVLVPALGVLCLGMAAAVTGTVAWFSQNTVVQGSGMNVKSTTATNLVISNQQAGTYSDSATSDFLFSGTLSPASTTLAGLKTGTFYVADDEKVNYDSGRLTAGSVVTTATVESSGTPVTASVVKHDFWIKCEGAAGTTVENVKLIDLSIDGVNKEISNAVRVGIVCGTNAYIYRTTGGDESVQGLKGTGTVTSVDGSNVVKVGETTISEATTAAEEGVGKADLLVATLGTDAVEVDVYVWYEGQDTHCKSAYATSNESLAISFKLDY